MERSDDLEKLENEELSSWGGKRDGSGRKPLLDKEQVEEVKALIRAHGTEEVTTELGKRSRILSLLDSLYDAGAKGNIPAAKEYLDRVLGKAAQPIEGDISITRLIVDDGDNQKE